MNEKQYLKLCKFADEILLDSNATPVRISIQWLHIIREHPVLLKNYETLFLTHRANFESIRIWLNPILIKLSLLKLLLKSFFYPDVSEWSKTLDHLSPRDILFISLLVNETQFESRTDLYYYDLPLKLNEYGFPSLIAMLNHTKELSSHFSEKQSKEKIYSVVFSQNLGLFNELKNLRLLLKESRILRKSARSERHSLKKKYYIRHLLKLCLQVAYIPCAWQHS